MENLQIISPADLANILAGINGLILLIIHRNRAKKCVTENNENSENNNSVQKTKKIDVKLSGSLRLKIRK